MRTVVQPGHDPELVNVIPGEHYVFDPLLYIDVTGCTDRVAKMSALRERNRMLIRMRKAGVPCKGWSLNNQLRGYSSLGVPDGRYRTVYYATVLKSPL